MIEKKLKTIDQLAIGVRVFFLAVHNNIGIVIRLSEPLLVPISLDNQCSAVLISSKTAGSTANPNKRINLYH